MILRATFSELLIDVRSKTFRDFTQDPVNWFAFEFFAGDRLEENEISHVTGVVVRNNIFLLNGHQVWQQNVGIFCR